MGQVLVGDRYKVTTFVRHPSGQNQCNRHYYHAVSSVGVDIQDYDALQGVADKLRDIYKLIIPQTSTFQGIKWVKETTPTPAENVSLVTLGGGTYVNDALPPQVCPLISWRSTGAPSGVRGRSFMPSPAEPENTADGSVAPAVITDLNTAALAMRYLQTIFAGAGKSLSWQKEIKQESNLPISYWVVNAHIVRTRFATQRRRSAINRSDTPLA